MSRDQTSGSYGALMRMIAGSYKHADPSGPKRISSATHSYPTIPEAMETCKEMLLLRSGYGV